MLCYEVRLSNSSGSIHPHVKVFAHNQARVNDTAADVACRHVGGLEDKRLVTAHLERLEIMCHHHPLSRQHLPAGANGRLLTDVDLELSGQNALGRSPLVFV
eukprot:1157560-Pelagomonas_calceolata.AAC.5